MEPVRISFFVPILLICGMLSLKSLMKIFALTWLLFISVLFFLPGSALPQGDLFDFPYFDKVVHFVFFLPCWFFPGGSILIRIGNLPGSYSFLRFAMEWV